MAPVVRGSRCFFLAPNSLLPTGSLSSLPKQTAHIDGEQVMGR